MYRRELRDYTFKMLFHVEFYKEEEMEEQIANYVSEMDELGDAERSLLIGKIKEILPQLTTLNEKISAASQGWKLNRMNKVDLTIIRLALYEMLFDDEVPTKVAINEAVELAKKYGGDESPQFVNGILAKLV